MGLTFGPGRCSRPSSSANSSPEQVGQRGQPAESVAACEWGAGAGGRVCARARPPCGLGSGGPLSTLPPHTPTAPVPLLHVLTPPVPEHPLTHVQSPRVCPRGSGSDLTPMPAEPAGSPHVPGPPHLVPSSHGCLPALQANQCSRRPNKTRPPLLPEPHPVAPAPDA